MRSGREHDHAGFVVLAGRELRQGVLARRGKSGEAMNVIIAERFGQMREWRDDSPTRSRRRLESACGPRSPTTVRRANAPDQPRKMQERIRGGADVVAGTEKSGCANTSAG